MKGKVLVAGIGNIFLGDDGFGPEVVNRLRDQGLPAFVTVADFGIRSYDLAYSLMEGWELVILVDALPRGSDPGTLYTIKPEFPEGQDTSIEVDAHNMNPVAVLQMVRALGGQTGPVVVVGCEPATIEPDPDGNFRLSCQVRAVVDEAVRMVKDLAQSVHVGSSAA